VLQRPSAPDTSSTNTSTWMFRAITSSTLLKCSNRAASKALRLCFPAHRSVSRSAYRLRFTVGLYQKAEPLPIPLNNSLVGTIPVLGLPFCYNSCQHRSHLIHLGTCVFCSCCPCECSIHTHHFPSLHSLTLVVSPSPVPLNIRAASAFIILSPPTRGTHHPHTNFSSPNTNLKKT
jgi:hypothetical protein